MAWGTVTVGGLQFRETITAAEASGKLSITGQESYPPQSSAAVHAAHLNVLGLPGATVPVTFTDKTELDGFYTVTDASSDLLNQANGSLLSCTWQVGLVRVGTERDLEFESRFEMIGRSTELSGLSPVFWAAPPPATTSFYTGTTNPSGSLVRHTADGDITVYTGLPTTPAPKWTVTASGYMGGSARVLLDGLRRVGSVTPAFSMWEVNNGIVQVTGSGSSASFTVAAWSGTGWVSAKTYTPTINGATLAAAPELTIIRDDPEQTIVRLSYPTLPGRVSVDLSLRRGARIVTGVIKRQSSATLGVTRTMAEAATVVTGGLKATAADSDGDRFVMGSSKTLTTTTATASIGKASVTALDFFLGHEFDPSPAAGDAFADLLAQYLGSAGEQTRAVRR